MGTFILKVLLNRFGLSFKYFLPMPSPKPFELF